MNIENLLQLLTENREINYINEKLKGKVSPKVIETLSSLMKKEKYDNIALAIFDALQNWDEYPHAEKCKAFIEKRPKLVYAALKEAGKDNSNFDPKRELDFFRIRADEEDPMKFWSEFRSDHKDYKEKVVLERKEKKAADEAEKKNFGLRNVSIKEMDDCFLIFPRNWKWDFVISPTRVSDLERQKEDLRHISMTIANRDTSGEEEAKENHWCVSASDSDRNMFKRYKGAHKGGVFIIVVKKATDGSPDWNNRYLFWTGPAWDEKDADLWDYEFADKFNDHIYDISRVFSKKTTKFLLNVVHHTKTPKGDKQFDALRKNISRVSDEEDEKEKRSINRESPVVKNYWKVLRFLRSKYASLNTIASPDKVIANALKEYKPNEQKVRDRYIKGEQKVTINTYDGNNYKIEYFKNTNSIYPDWTCAVDAHKLKAMLAKPDEWTRFIDPKLVRKLNQLSAAGSVRPKTYLLYDTEPPKNVKDALHNNKLAIQLYSSNRLDKAIDDDEIREFFMGPHFEVSVIHGNNHVYFLPKAWDNFDENMKQVGDLDDPDIVEKVKQTFEKELEHK